MSWITAMIAAISVGSVVFFAISQKNFIAKNRAENSEALYQYLINARDNIVACGLLYPRGDNGTGFSVQFPGGTDKTISTLECPGNTAANKSLWSGKSTAAYLQPLPVGFDQGLYTNDANGIKLVVTSQVAQAEVFELVARKFAANEVEYTAEKIILWIKK